MKVRWVGLVSVGMTGVLASTGCTVSIQGVVSLTRQDDQLIAHVDTCWGEQTTGLKLEPIDSSWFTPPAAEWSFEATDSTDVTIGTVQQTVDSMVTYAEIEGRILKPTMKFSIVGVSDPVLGVRFNEQDLYVLQEREYLVQSPGVGRTTLDAVSYEQHLAKWCGW